MDGIALSGAASGVKNKLDAFGVCVLAFVAGNAGGVTRDLLIGGDDRGRGPRFRRTTDRDPPRMEPAGSRTAASFVV